MVWCKRTFVSKQGGVINTVVANATARVLISRNPNAVANVDVKSSRWAKVYLQEWTLPSKKEIPEKMRKETEFFFLHDIVLMVEEHHIPLAFILKIDQIP